MSYSELVRATYVGGYVIDAEFADGLKVRVHLSPFLRGPVFEPLKDTEKFRKFRVDSTFGTIGWSNGADIAPEALYEHARTAAEKVEA